MNLLKFCCYTRKAQHFCQVVRIVLFVSIKTKINPENRGNLINNLTSVPCSTLKPLSHRHVRKNWNISCHCIGPLALFLRDSLFEDNTKVTPWAKKVCKSIHMAICHPDSNIHCVTENTFDSEKNIWSSWVLWTEDIELTKVSKAPRCPMRWNCNAFVKLINAIQLVQVNMVFRRKCPTVRLTVYLCIIQKYFTCRPSFLGKLGSWYRD